MISNMYRSMAGAGVLLACILSASLVPDSYRPAEIAVALFIFIGLFTVSWVKQEGYVEKRIKFNLEERDSDE